MTSTRVITYWHFKHKFSARSSDKVYASENPSSNGDRKLIQQTTCFPSAEQVCSDRPSLSGALYQETFLRFSHQEKKNSETENSFHLIACVDRGTLTVMKYSWQQNPEKDVEGNQTDFFD